MAPRRQLEESIRHIRSELADGDPLSSEDRALLDRTLAEVATRLDDDDDDFSITDSVNEELQELAARIEGTRPNLSILLGRIIDSLSQLGI